MEWFGGKPKTSPGKENIDTTQVNVADLANILAQDSNNLPPEKRPLLE